MNQSISIAHEDDESTQTYTQSELELMRSDVHVPVVRLEDFAEAGNRGTPAGMVGSRNEACLLIVGVCGEGHVETVGLPARSAESELDEAETPEQAEASVEERFDDSPIAREWAPAQAEPSADEPAEGEGEGEGERAVPWQWLLVPAAALLAVVVVLAIRRGGPPEPPPAPDESRAKEVEVAEAEPVELGPRQPDLGASTELVEVPVPAAAAPSESPKPHKTLACRRARADAEHAHGAGNWSLVKSLTKRRECWGDNNARKALRMSAMFELSELEACVKLGRGSGNRKVAVMRKRCELAQKK